MDADAEAERVRVLILLLATIDTVLKRLDEDRIEDVGLMVRLGELEDFVRQDLQQAGRERRSRPAFDQEPRPPA